jgi:hypothetical protein
MQPALAWAGVGALAVKDKIGLIREMPGGVWRRTIGESWRIVFNGTPEAKKPEDAPELPPFGIYVEYNGWPAGILHPSGGIIAAGEGANENTFIAAIEADLGKPIDEALA